MTPSENREYQFQSRLKALLANWSLTRKKIDTTHNDAAALGPSEHLRPSLFRKFTQWMEQIAGLESKEQDILSEIDAVERKHKQMRKEHRLPKAQPSDKLPDQPKPEDPKSRSRFWTWALLYLAFSSGKKKQPDPKNG